MPANTKALRKRLHRQLSEARGEELVRVHGPTVPKITKDGLEILCGDVNQKRDKSLEHVLRSDGAWFDFHMMFEETSPPRLKAYGFEIRFPVNETFPEEWPRWIRYDLNAVGHANDGDGLRSHLHPGCEDLQVPAPVCLPDEIVAMLIHGFRPRREEARTKG